MTSRPTVHIGERIATLAADHPDVDAVVAVRPNGAEMRLTWRELEGSTNAAARLLEGVGVDHDSIVVVCLPNGIPHVVATIAAWKLGALVVPVSPRLSERELSDVLAKVPQGFVIGNRRGQLQPEDLLDAQNDAPFVSRGVPRSAALTGGSTGTPRIVRRRHAWVYDPDDPSPSGYATEGMRLGQVQLVPLPLFHAGFQDLFNGLALDHTVVIMESFSPTLFLRLIEEHRVNFLVTVPTQMRAVLGVRDVDSFDLSSIEAMYHRSAPCPEAVKRRWLELVPPKRLFEDYGSIENIGFLTIRGDQWLAHPGSVGLSGADVAVRILDDDGNDVPAGEIGEIYLLSSRSTQPTYIGGGPLLRERSGYLTVGDLGYLDPDGYLHLVDRGADVINVGGLNVYPAEVEHVLLEFDGVVDVAVARRPHEVLGECVCAIVVRNYDERVTPSALNAHCLSRLLPSKVPMFYEFVPRLPRNEAGKIRRRDL
jgi:bile acid-coenzyme A ligase